MEKMIKKLINYAIIVLLIEIFFCNFPFFIYPVTHNTNKTELDMDTAVYGTGLERIDATHYKVTEPTEAFILFDELDMPIDSLYIDCERVEGKKITRNSHNVSIGLEVSDEGNAIPYFLAEHTIEPNTIQTKWMQPELYGNAKSLKISFSMKKEDVIQITGIFINKPRPFYFNWSRISVMLIVILIVNLMNPNGKVCQLEMFPWKKEYTYLIGGTVLLSAVLLIGNVYSLRDKYKSTLQDETAMQYSLLAKSLAHGEVYLDREVEEYLIEMDNPYDYQAREQLAEEKGKDYFWDAAYYDGKYYVYFGIFPVLIFHLPYYLITHHDLPDFIPGFFICIGIWIMSFRLFYIICKKWFQKIPFLLYYAYSVAFAVTCGTGYLFQNIVVYELAILTGVFLAITGFDLWIESIDKGKIVSYWKLLMGSLLVALLTATRPTMFLMAVVAIPIYTELVYNNGKCVIRKNCKALICFAIPFVIVAIGVMYYNYARFGSIFDFGANYNLTTNDMTKRGFRLGRLASGLWGMLIQPLSLSLQFPFITLAPNTTAYMGQRITGYYGGVLFILPILFFTIVGLKNYRKMIPNRLLKMGYLMIATSVVIAIVDSNIAGTLMRYMYDFVWMLLVFTGVILFTMNVAVKQKDRIMYTAFLKVVFILLWIGIFNTCLARISELGKMNNQYIFYHLKYMFEMWL